ncbi:LOW QUALITY PROTEIN: hypothetical protein HID58_035451 [Brassica napus]|uniref:Uncharacterized protein n=1 Tax=Brassica napus TaxID=3708 RepID=A0ABQ8C6R5_BRANA|nr:LOW QUALITY PROTEIN: hypothetical protein HID58_035451 [Brassica napus]
MKSGRESRREKGDLRFFSGARPARERPCRRRKPYSFSKRFLFASSSSRLTDRFVGALDWNHPQRWFPCVEGRRGRVEAHGVRREACIGDSGRWRLSQIHRRRFVLREVEASLASPPRVLVPGKGRLSLLRFRRFWLRRPMKLSIDGDDDMRRKAVFLRLGLHMPSRLVDVWDELAVSPLMLSVTSATVESRSTVTAGMRGGVIRLSRQGFLG